MIVDDAFVTELTETKVLAGLIVLGETSSPRIADSLDDLQGAARSLCAEDSADERTVVLSAHVARALPRDDGRVCVFLDPVVD